MYTLLLKLALPYLQKFLANKAADYLQERRKGLKESVNEVIEQPVEALKEAVTPEENTGGITASTIWFTLSGLLLGGAFGLILYVLMRDSNSRF